MLYFITNYRTLEFVPAVTQLKYALLEIRGFAE